MAVEDLKIGIIIDVVARVRQLRGHLAGLAHGRLLGGRHGHRGAQRVRLLILRAALRAGRGGAEQEKLPVVGLVRQQAEQVIGLIGTRDVVDPRDQPAVDDLRVELLILGRQGVDGVGSGVIHQQLRVARLQRPAFPLGRGAFGRKFHIIFDIQLGAVRVPVVQQPFVGGIFAHGVHHVRGNIRAEGLRLLLHVAFGVKTLGKVGDDTGHQTADDKKYGDLRDDADLILFLCHCILSWSAAMAARRRRFVCAYNL